MKLAEVKYPTVPFTHTELGAFNGVDRHDVWSNYQKAIKTGLIIPNGELRKNGKGKAAVVWIMNPNPPVAGTVVEAPVIPKAPKAVKAPKAPKVPKVKVADLPPVNVVNVNPTPEGLPTVQPATAPVVETVINPTVMPDVVHAQQSGTTEIDNLCPVCQSKLLSMKDANGILVWCGKPFDVCQVQENPSGHGKNIADAHEVICQKFGKR